MKEEAKMKEIKLCRFEKIEKTETLGSKRVRDFCVEIRFN